MPTTSVANKSGAMIVRMRFRKIRLSSLRLTANPGQSLPISAPATIATRIHVVSDFRRQPYTTNASTTSHRMTIMKKLSVYAAAHL